MDLAVSLRAILSEDREGLHILSLVRSLRLPDCWVAAGFVRNSVWDFLHNRPRSRGLSDVDVIWFDPARCHPSEDARIEARLRKLDSSVRWSVKNQSRMHFRNGDRPYLSAANAMRYWPETATAVAVRATHGGHLEIIAPFGLGDLFNLIVAPTPHFRDEKHSAYLNRIRQKNWPAVWPRLQIQERQ